MALVELDLISRCCVASHCRGRRIAKLMHWYYFGNGHRLLQLDLAKALAELKRMVAFRQQSEAPLAELIGAREKKKFLRQGKVLEGVISRLSGGLKSVLSGLAYWSNRS